MSTPMPMIIWLSWLCTEDRNERQGRRLICLGELCHVISPALRTGAGIEEGVTI